MANINQSMQEILQELKSKAIYDPKGDLANVIGSPAVGMDSVPVLLNKLQVNKNNLASNLGSKGIAASGSESIESLVGKVGGLGTIKSIQSGTTSILYASGSSGYNSITINAVNPKKCLIFHSFTSSMGGSNTAQYTYWYVYNETTIRVNFSNDTSSQFTNEFSWYVIEFTDSAVDIQTGFVSTGSSAKLTTVSINPVDTAKTVLYTGIFNYGNGHAFSMYYDAHKAVLLNSTTLEFSRTVVNSSSDAYGYVWYYVITFK